MRPFKDSQGRTWEVAINAGTLGRVKAMLNIDLPGLFADDMQGLANFIVDPYARANVLYVLCKTQADKLNLTDEDFGSALDGDAMEAGTTAMREELINFFPAAKREALRRVLGKMDQVGEILLTKGMAKMEALDLEKEADAALANLLGRSKRQSGNAPESLASTPALSP